MKKVFFGTLFFLLLNLVCLFADEWVAIGNKGFSEYNAEQVALYVYSSTPYVVYKDLFDNKATVMKYNGTVWETVGSRGFSSGSIESPCIFVDGGIPYVAYRDTSLSSKLVVKKYTGIGDTGWEDVGNENFNITSVSFPSLYIYNGMPYVAYRNSSSIMVYKYTGNGVSGWEQVGTGSITCSTDGANMPALFVAAGIPYVGFTSNNGNKAAVMKYTGIGETGWEDVGQNGFSDGGAFFTSLYISSGVPYMVFSDMANSYKTTVMKYTGSGASGWESVGTKGFATSYFRNSISVYNGVPYVAYTNVSNGYKATLSKYTGSGTTGWEPVGIDGFSDSGGVVYNLSLSIYNGSPFVAYIDQANPNKVTVMKYQVSSGGSVSARTFNYIFTRNSANDVSYRSQLDGQDVARLQIDESLLGGSADNLAENEFSDIVFIQNFAEGKPYINVPETNRIAQAVNADLTGSRVVTATFYNLPKSRFPAIMLNGKQITDTKGNIFPAYSGYIKNIDWDNSTGTLTFEIAHFSEYGVPVLIGKTFTGTAADEAINASGSDIGIYYYGGTVSGDVNQDKETMVLSIHGLAYETVLTDVPSTLNNLYKPLVPGTTYNVSFEYINRGNDTDQVDLTTSIIRTNTGHFNVSNNQNKNVAPWQVVSFNVEMDADNALAYERATVDVTVALNGVTATSYNSFEDAYQGGTFGNDGRYGGVTNLQHRFVLEAEGYSISILSRSLTVNAPLDYTGVPVSEANIVPGAKVKYTIVLKNNNNSVATSVNLTDIIPDNCHLYYTEAPEVEGAALWAWRGATDNNADKNTADAVKYEITIPSQGRVTASYTVTVD